MLHTWKKFRRLDARGCWLPVCDAGQSGSGKLRKLSPSLMEAGRLSAEEIARKNGFGNCEWMRRSFVRAFGKFATGMVNRYFASARDGLPVAWREVSEEWRPEFAQACLINREGLISDLVHFPV